MLGYLHGGHGLASYVVHYFAARALWDALGRLAGPIGLTLAGMAAVGFLWRLGRSGRVGGPRNWYRSTYLRSSHWRRTRRAAVERAGRRCEHRSLLGVRCPHRGALDVHHLTYDRLGHERPGDLRVLCRRHHDQEERSR